MIRASGRQHLAEVLFEPRGGHHVELTNELKHHTPGIVPAFDRKLGRDGVILIAGASHADTVAIRRSAIRSMQDSTYGTRPPRAPR